MHFGKLMSEYYVIYVFFIKVIYWSSLLLFKLNETLNKWILIDMCIISNML